MDTKNIKTVLRAKLVDGSNILVMSNFKDIQGECYVSDGMFFIESETPRGRYNSTHRTSLITNYAISDKKLYIKTLNSQYYYEILSGSKDAFEKELQQMNCEGIELLKEMRSEKSQRYMAETVDGWLVPITLPQMMNWEEATEHIKKNPIFVYDMGRALQLVSRLCDEARVKTRGEKNDSSKE